MISNPSDDLAKDLYNQHPWKLPWSWKISPPNTEEHTMTSIENLERMNDTLARANEYTKEMTCICGEDLEATQVGKEHNLNGMIWSASIECQAANKPGDHISFNLEFTRNL
jgi:hypothetical protein